MRDDDWISATGRVTAAAPPALRLVPSLEPRISGAHAPDAPTGLDAVTAADPMAPSPFRDAAPTTPRATGAHPGVDVDALARALDPAAQLSPLARGLLHALIAPSMATSRVTELADLAGEVGLPTGPLVRAARAAGVVVAAHARACASTHPVLATLSRDLEPDAQRQRFISRERLATAERAARRLGAALGYAPLAVGELAGTWLAHSTADTRLSGPLTFAVRREHLIEGLAAIAHLPGVVVTDTPLTARVRAREEDGLWRRASPETSAGFRLPSPEDLLLVHAAEARDARETTRVGLRLDVAHLAEERLVYWPAVAMRARDLRLRRALARLLDEARRSLGADLPPETLEALAPTPWSRLLETMLGA